MIDNYLPLFKIEDQLKKETTKQIEQKLNQIVIDIENRREKIIRKGLISDVLSKPIHSLAARYHYDGADKRFVVYDNCDGCRICERVCPVNNIKVETKPEFLHRCESCYACIHHCPQNAIHLKSERSETRFINPNVKLKEVIDANNQIR